MKSDDMINLLHDYVRETLSEAERQTVEAALERDPHLRKELERIHTYYAALNALTPVQASRDFALKVHLQMKKSDLAHSLARRLLVPFYIKVPIGFAAAAGLALLIVFVIRPPRNAAPDRLATAVTILEKSVALPAAEPTQDKKRNDGTAKKKEASGTEYRGSAVATEKLAYADQPVSAKAKAVPARKSIKASVAAGAPSPAGFAGEAAFDSTQEAAALAKTSQEAAKFSAERSNAGEESESAVKSLAENPIGSVASAPAAPKEKKAVFEVSMSWTPFASRTRAAELNETRSRAATRSGEAPSAQMAEEERKLDDNAGGTLPASGIAPSSSSKSESDLSFLQSATYRAGGTFALSTSSSASYKLTIPVSGLQKFNAELASRGGLSKIAGTSPDSLSASDSVVIFLKMVKP